MPPDAGERLAAALESSLHFSVHIFYSSPLGSYFLCLFCLAAAGWSYGMARRMSMAWQVGLAFRGGQWHSSHHPGLRADHCKVFTFMLEGPENCHSREK